LGGEGERDEGVEGDELLYHDFLFIRREKERLVDGRGLGVTEPGVVAGVDVLRKESMLVLALGSFAEDSTLLLSSSSQAEMARCTLIFGLF